VRQHPPTMSPQQVQPPRTFGVALPDQVNEVAYLLHRHARSPQPQHHVEQIQGVPVEDATPAAVPVHRAKQPSSVVVVQSVDRQTRESRHVTNQQIVIVQASQLRKCRRCAHMTSLQPGAHSRSNSVLQSVSVLSMSRERTHSPALNEPHDEAVVSAAVQRITGKFDTRRR
jgi:hypothetical protein